jgi:hypothetical protein
MPIRKSWLVQRGRIDEASQILHRLHGSDSAFAEEELLQIRAQLSYERQQFETDGGYGGILRRRRTLSTVIGLS